MPVRNGAADLARCLGSLLASAGDMPIEIVVVDNGSTDASAAVAQRHGARVLSRPGLKVGACRNAGASEASAPLLAFVDADHEVTSEWVSACIGAFRDPTTAAAGYLCRAPEAGTWVQRIYDALRARDAGRRDVEWLGAGNLAIRREVFQSVGGFDESLEACEDVQLCHAIRRAGHRIVSEPDMGSVHHGDPRGLGELFFGELWRGRDNLRVSLAGPLTLRSLPGLVLPVTMLASLALIGLGALAWPWMGPDVALAGLALSTGIVAARTFVIVRRGRLSTPVGWLQAAVVAATYDTARALSIVSGATHRTRMRVRHA
jgi:hypothetical protein